MNINLHIPNFSNWTIFHIHVLFWLIPVAITIIINLVYRRANRPDPNAYKSDNQIGAAFGVMLGAGASFFRLCICSFLILLTWALFFLVCFICK